MSVNFNSGVKFDASNSSAVDQKLKDSITKNKGNIEGNINQVLDAAQADGVVTQEEVNLINQALKEDSKSSSVISIDPKQLIFNISKTEKPKSEKLHILIKSTETINDKGVEYINKKTGHEMKWPSYLSSNDTAKAIEKLVKSNGFDPEKFKTDDAYNDQVVRAVAELFAPITGEEAEKIADILFRQKSVSPDDVKFIQESLKKVGQEDLLKQGGVKNGGTDGKFGVRTATAVDRLLVALGEKMKTQTEKSSVDSGKNKEKPEMVIDIKKPDATSKYLNSIKPEEIKEKLKDEPIQILEAFVSNNILSKESSVAILELMKEKSHDEVVVNILLSMSTERAKGIVEASPKIQESLKKEIDSTKENIAKLKLDVAKEEKEGSPNLKYTKIALEESEQKLSSLEKLQSTSPAPKAARVIPPIPPEVLKDHPKLKVLEGVLNIENYDDPVVKGRISELAKLPEATLKKLKENGLKEIHVAKKGITDLDSNSDLKGTHPRNWPEDKTWDNVSGVYNPSNKSVSVGNGEDGSSSVMIHEVSHAIGDVLGLDNSPEVISAHKRLFDKLDPYQKGGSVGGNVAGVQEMLAESIAVLLHDGEAEAIKKYDKELVDFLKLKLGM